MAITACSAGDERPLGHSNEAGLLAGNGGKIWCQRVATAPIKNTADDVEHRDQRALEDLTAADDQGKRLETSTESGITLLGDREPLTQMLANLVENALRHTPSGTRMRTYAERSCSSLRLVVADDGPGIAPDERQRVLRRVYRLDASRAMPGSGLGLSLAAAVAKLHGADLSLEDNCPGLRVSILIPATSRGQNNGRRRCRMR